MNIYEIIAIYASGVSSASILGTYLLIQNNKVAYETRLYMAIISLWGSWISFIIFILIANVNTKRNKKQKAPKTLEELRAKRRTEGDIWL